jgi:dTDP-4-amino-4,6-dideoxygalactose transaminase
MSWKKYTGLPFAHFINSNTSGLHLAIKILKDSNKWNDGDEIITTPLTFVSSNHSIMYENLTPVFADVDETLCLDPDSVMKNITKKTRAILYVGIGGNAGRLSQIKNICRQHGLKLILDAAHMSGTWTKSFIEGGSYLEHAGHGADVSVFSFQSVKNLPTADSGMICFKNEDYDQLVRKLSWLGISKDTFQRTNEKGSYKWEYDLVDVGYKYHGNSIMACMALVGLKYLEDDNKRRREICKMYEDAFCKEGIDSIKMSEETEIPSRHLYQIRVDRRNEVMEYLNNNDIYPGVHYRDNTNYKMYNHGFGNCPFAHKISEEIISLPLHLYLTDNEVKKVIDMVIKATKI